MRSNWKTYLEEFAAALEITGIPSSLEIHQLDELQTPHERKYQQSGHTLWRLKTQL